MTGDSGIIATILALLACVLGSAFFSSTETGLTAVSRARLYQLVQEGNRRARIVSKLRQKKESFIGTILLGNTAVNILGSSLATYAAVKMWGEDGVVYVTVVLTLIILIFGEVLPKTYAINNAERVALLAAPVIDFLIKLFYPITYTVQKFIDGLCAVLGINIKEGTSLISSIDVIRGTIELHHQQGAVMKQERDMLGSILDLDNITVSDIMVHRKNVETIDANLPPEEIVRQAIQSSHSRIPLWQDEPDNIIGVLHVKGLLKILHNPTGPFDYERILRTCAKPWYIPDTTTLREQLYAFRQQRKHFAMVVDEYGALLGMVTLEDIIEEIVGEIDDEYDKIDATDIMPVKGQDNTFIVEGEVTIRDLNRHFDWSLPDENASTVAGLVIHEAALIPDIGESFDFHGFRFTVMGKQSQQITRIKIQKMPEEHGEPVHIS